MGTAAWERILELWSHPALGNRYGEEVSLEEHMLQAAAGATGDGAPPELVVAALLHDVGHLTGPEVHPDDRNRDHAVVGAERLADVFGKEVTEPIRLHIAAKRYLVTTDPTYHHRLSPASVHTLQLQGGPLSAVEHDAFLREPHRDGALRVRGWDEAAKVAGAVVPRVEHYRAVVEALGGAPPPLG